MERGGIKHEVSGREWSSMICEAVGIQALEGSYGI